MCRCDIACEDVNAQRREKRYVERKKDRTDVKERQCGCTDVI